MTKKQRVLIYGMGEFAQLMRLYLSREAHVEVVAYVADLCFIKERTTFDNLPLVPFEQVDQLFSNQCYTMLVAAGYSNMRNRQIMFEKAQRKGYSFINYISHSAIVDEATSIGSNNIILNGSIVEPGVVIGSNNIIWASVNISHDSTIGDHCFFASKSLIGGKSKVADGCFLGFGSVCIQNICLERETLVGAGSLIIKNTSPFSKNYGSPAVEVAIHKEKGICIV